MVTLPSSVGCSCADDERHCDPGQRSEVKAIAADFMGHLPRLRREGRTGRPGAPTRSLLRTLRT